MKAIKVILSSAVFASVAFSTNVQAESENPISNLTSSSQRNMFSTVTYQSSTPEGILSYGDNYNKNSVWSTEYEQYVNPDHFKQPEIVNLDDADQYMGRNPTAAGRMTDRETFIYNETAGEYHLQ